MDVKARRALLLSKDNKKGTKNNNLHTHEKSNPNNHRVHDDFSATRKGSVSGSFYTFDQRADLRKALSPLASVRMGVFQHTRVPALHDLDDDSDAQGLLINTADALTQTWTSDAHCQPAFAQELYYEDERGVDRAYRVSKSLATQTEILIETIVFDFDLNSHRQWSDNDEFKSVVKSWSNHSLLRGAVIYQTRGGLRAVLPMQTPYQSITGDDWALVYAGISASLPEHRSGAWDPSCRDLSRLFRLPYVERRKSEASRDTDTQKGLVYVPTEIRKVRIPTEIYDAATTQQAKATSRKGVKGLVQFFDRRGWLGSEIKQLNGAPAFAAECPWGSSHSSSTSSSTILMHTQDGEYVLHCMHASCRQHYEGGAWARALQLKHPEDWDECCEEKSHFIFEAHNAKGFLHNAIEALRKAHPSKLFQKHGRLVGLERDAFGSLIYREYTTDDLTGELNRCAQWVKIANNKEGTPIPVATSVPKTAVAQAYAEIARAHPQIRGKTQLPIIDDKTKLPTRYSEGYCQRTGLYYSPSSDLDLDGLKRHLQRKITREGVVDALNTLKDLFIDFPWARPEHVGLALSVVMTAALRKSIDGAAPLHFVSANVKGSGKTKLTQTALACVYGFVPSLSPCPERTEELEKSLTAALFSNRPYYLVDNVTGSFGSGVLDAVITSDKYQARVLGKSDFSEIENRCFFAATGNNATLGADTDRRAILLRLVSQMERPEERSGFRYPDLLKEAEGRVTKTWCALLDILRGYDILASAEERAHIATTKKGFGSFERWSEAVREPLMWALSMVFPRAETVDVVAMSAAEMEYSRGDNRVEVMDYLIEWQKEYETRTGEKEWGTKHLCTALRSARDAETGDYLEEWTESLNSLKPQYIGRLLKARRDVVCNGFALRIRVLRGRSLYCLEEINPQPPISEPPRPEPPRPEPPKPEPPQNPLDTESINIATLSAPDWVTECAESKLIEENQRCLYYGDNDICMIHGICEHSAEGTIMLGEELKKAIESSEDRTEDMTKTEKQLECKPDALERIKTLYAMREKYGVISNTLNEEGYPPPSGKKWTPPKIGLIVRQNGWKQPKKEEKKADKTAQIVLKKGHWEDYYPKEHPLRQPTLSQDLEQRRVLNLGKNVPLHNQSPSGVQHLNTAILIKSVFGEDLTPRQIVEERVLTRDEEAEQDD